jgi:hypothetical protein
LGPGGPRFESAHPDHRIESEIWQRGPVYLDTGPHFANKLLTRVYEVNNRLPIRSAASTCKLGTEWL